MSKYFGKGGYTVSTIYLLVDSNNVIQSASYTVPTVPSGYTMDGVADSATNATATLTAPSGTYAYSGGTIIRRPYFSLSYGAGTLTATLQAYTGAIPVVSFSVAGQSYPVTAVTNATTGVITATLALAVHPSLAQSAITVGVSASGFVSASIPVAGTQTPAVGVQAYTDTAGAVHVAPTSKEYLAGYWSGTVSPAYVMQDVATADSVTADAVFNVILPWVMKQSTPPTLTAAQQQTITDWQTNVSPDLVTTLASAMSDPHYVQYKVDMAATKNALNGYQADLVNIPNLV